MKNFLKQSHWIWLCFVVLLGVVAVALAAGTRREEPTSIEPRITSLQSPIQVINKIKSLEIVSQGVANEMVNLVLRNVSKRTITAIAIYSGPRRAILELGENNQMESGQERAIPFSIDKESPLVIGAAIYEKGDPDGETYYIDKVLNLRKGRSMEAVNILPFLEKAAVSGPVVDSAIDAAMISISTLIIREDMSSPVDIYIGRREAYDEALGSLQEIKKEEASQKASEKLTKLITRFKSIKNQGD